MRFQTLTEEEIQTASLAPEGVYEYYISAAKEGISKYSGNEKMDLTLKIFDAAGKEHTVFSNLSLAKLLKHFCDVNNLVDQYKAGELTESMCINKSGGRVIIGIEAEKPDGKGGMYKAKNIVKDYVSAPHGSMTAPAAMKPLPETKNDFIDDADIPF